MFNLTHYKMTAANSGGNLIRPLTGNRMILTIPETDNDSTIDSGEYVLECINVDTYNDVITFMNNGFLLKVSGTVGTLLIIDGLRTEPK